MKKLLLVIFVLFFSIVNMEIVKAESYTDKLCNCLMDEITKEEMLSIARFQTIRYVYHPKMQDLISIDKHQIEKFTKQYVNIQKKLILERCKKEAKKAYKLNGIQSITKCMQILGRVTQKSITRHPNVRENFGKNINKYIDYRKFKDELTK